MDLPRGREAMNSSPVVQLLGISFYFSTDEARSIISELDSLTEAGQLLPSVLEGVRRDINMQLSQPYGGVVAANGASG